MEKLKIKKSAVEELLAMTKDQKKDKESYTICRIKTATGPSDNWHILPSGKELIANKTMCRQEGKDKAIVVERAYGPADIKETRIKAAELQNAGKHDICGQCVGSLYRKDTPTP